MRSVTSILTFLLMVTTAMSSTSSYGSEGNTIFVDDDNSSGPYNGTIDHPFRFIADAIHYAGENDIIFVFSGFYPERLKINKSIVLIGENKKTTILDGKNEGTVIDIYANNVEISGFTIQNSGSGFSYEACAISIRADQVTIYDTIISNNFNGIHIDYSFQSTSLHHNQIHNNKKNGVIVTYSNEFQVYDNDIYDNGAYGCSISNSIQGSIHNNLILSNNKSGVTFWESSENDFHSNTLDRNTEYGIFMNYSQNNDIYRNTIQNCSLGVYLYDSGRNKFYVNNFLENFNGHAFFHSFIRRVTVNELSSYGRNTWQSNYWDTWTGNRAFIINGILSFPSRDFSMNNYDRSPAQVPYNIG